MIYSWCTSCNNRKCMDEGSHRAQRFINYRADFMLGGRFGKRIRKLFSNKKDAESYEYVTKSDYIRGMFIGSTESNISIKELYDQYEQKKVRLYMKGAEVEIYRLKEFLELFGKRPLSSLKLLDWDTYVNKRSQKGTAQTTINRELTSLKTMLKWAVDNGFIKTNPFEKAKKFKVDNVRIRWLDEKELNDILANCTKNQDLDLRDILEVAANTGFRKGNLERLTAHDIVGNRLQAVKTKSGKAYDIPISSNLATLLQRLVHKSGPILNFKNFRRRFDAVVKDPTVTLHTFRHTFAAQCLKKGIPIDMVCKWMGHHSMEFTRSHYGHLSPNQEQINIELLNLGSAPTENRTPVSRLRI